MTQQLQLRKSIKATVVCLLLVCMPSAYAVEKWSRQLEATGPGQADSFSDWVPLAQPVDGSSKERAARVLTYSQSFPPNGRFGELSKAQQPFEFPYQLQRFPNAPPPPPQQLRQHSAPIASALKSQEPTSQSFFKFEMPYRAENGNRPAGSPSTLQTGYQIQHTFGGGAQATLFNAPFYNQQPVFPPEFQPLPQKPVQQHLQKQKPLHQQNFIEDTLPVKHNYRESKPQATQQALQAVTPQVFPVEPQPESGFELNKPTQFQVQSPFQQTGPAQPAAPTAPAGPPSQQQEVQLLYVPYDTLYNQQQQSQGPTAAQNPAFEVNKFNLNSGLPAVNPYQINQFYTQDPLAPQEPGFFVSSTTSRPPLTTSLRPGNIFQDFLIPQTTTAKPKPKAHQPPLAMFLLRTSARPAQSDVVSLLRNANNIAVIDAPTKNTPDIFVGPSGMPIPDGYVKFDLPYLSQLTQNRDLTDIPFFVAPLSYRTPNGFHKILLPEPHVGSIVINRAKDNSASAAVFSGDFNQYQTTASRPRPTSHRIKPTTSPKNFYPDRYEVTTQRATLQPSRGNKFNYFYDQDQVIHEVTSPKVNKHDRPKKKRPQTVQIEQPSFTQVINNPYAQFKPNELGQDEYFKTYANKPTTSSTSSTSTSTTSTSTTTSTTPAPPNFFTYNTNPQVDFHSSNGQLFHDFNAVSKAPEVEPEHVPRFTTRPPHSPTADDEYQMKQYFRQQDAFRNRPQFIHTTNSPFEQVQYTPVQLDYDREVTIPSTTQRTTTTTKHRVTYYTPSATPTPPAEETINTLPPHENVGEYGNVNADDKNVPANHRPSYNQNEILDGTVEYDPNPYQLPSELPPLAPNLPGLVNNLQDKTKLNQIEQSTTAAATSNEPEPPTRPTRRPINRIRKPVVTKITSSVSYSESETSSKRPVRPERVRRPYGTRGSTSTSDNAEDGDSSTTTTRRPSASRNPLLRNPNRVRYQPTPEERQTLKLKPRKHYNGSKKGASDEDLEYQRDVLKQNYPVFKGRKPTSPTAIPSSYAVTTTEGATSESQQVYTVTPSNNIDQGEQIFPAGLLEPMQIAQQYNEFNETNYGPGYFPIQEDLNPTEPVYKNEISPVFTTQPSSTSTTITQRTTTTEEPIATTRRSPFIRRNYPRPRATTTTEPATTAAPEERTTRSRIPPRKVIKVRARTRRPLHPASSTNSPEEETAPQEETKSNYRKLSRFNSDLYENDSPRRRYKSKFQLEGQESQWSPAIKSKNHFQPLDPKEASTEDEHKFENEPEIVTANPTVDAEEDNVSDTHEFSVSANFGSTNNEATKTTIKAPNLKPEKSFAELLEEVMGKAPNEQPLPTTDGTYFESQKTTTADRLNRRGKWKKLRTTAKSSESFETAESQNIGAHIFNSLNAAAQEKTTTPMTPTNAAEATALLNSTQQSTTTSTPLSTVDDYQLTTSTPVPTTTMKFLDFLTTMTPQTKGEAEEAVTQRTDLMDQEHSAADDLDTQSSLFSEVKKQLHDLFAIEDNEDDRAVTAALAAVGRRRQDYTNIKRERPATTETSSTESTAPTTESNETGDKKAFHKNLMEHVVYATSTSKQVTSETEICYRGRCIRSEDLPANHKLT